MRVTASASQPITATQCAVAALVSGVWALADGSQAGHGHGGNESALFPANQRLLDPSVPTTNASLPAAAAGAFKQAWATAAADRASGGGAPPSVETVQRWWRSLVAGAMPRLAPLSARACADVDSCLGTTLAGECVCVA